MIAGPISGRKSEKAICLTISFCLRLNVAGAAMREANERLARQVIEHRSAVLIQVISAPVEMTATKLDPRENDPAEPGKPVAQTWPGY